MHIQGRHKDGNLKALIFKIFGFNSLFNDNNLSVGWINDQRIAYREIASWNSEKPKYPKPEKEEYGLK